MTWAHERPQFGMRDVLMYAVGVAGLAASLTVVFLGMRAVLDIGGFCAEGGPYVIETHCPEGVPLLMVGGIFGLFLFGGLVAYKGASLGGPYGALVLLAWPVLFLSLGWNFLEYAVWPPEPASGVIWGWLIPGALFVLMGGLPLIFFLSSRRWARSASAPAADLVGARRQLLVDLNARVAGLGWTAESAESADGDLVDRLERLAALRASGALSELEFEQAKARLLEGRRP